MAGPDKSVLVEGYAFDVVQVVEAVVLFQAVVVVALYLKRRMKFYLILGLKLLRCYIFIDMKKIQCK